MVGAVLRSDGKTIKCARAALHMWEEPCISGESGSGAVFFSGCPLRCVYCQNRDIAGAERGEDITVERLAEIFLELQAKGAANINLVERLPTTRRDYPLQCSRARGKWPEASNCI